MARSAQAEEVDFPAPGTMDLQTSFRTDSRASFELVLEQLRPLGPVPCLGRQELPRERWHAGP